MIRVKSNHLSGSPKCDRQNLKLANTIEAMSKKRTNDSAEFKAKVISELFCVEKSLNELVATYKIASAALFKWHQQFQEDLPKLFGKRDSSKDVRIAELEQELQASQQKIDQLTIERDWLEKS